MLITVASYQAITGDTATSAAAVTAKIERAEDLLGEALGRPDAIESAERTETMRVDRAGRLHPLAVPITVATGYTIDGNTLEAGSPWPDQYGNVTVAYTGGWVERSANPSATNRLPAYIETDIAWAAYALLFPPPPPTSILPGATSVRLGDAAVNFGPDGPPRPGLTAIRWSRQTLKHRRRLAYGI